MCVAHERLQCTEKCRICNASLIRLASPCEPDSDDTLIDRFFLGKDLCFIEIESGICFAFMERQE
jgi:hypothetical protein